MQMEIRTGDEKTSRRWTRAEYQRLLDVGVFREGERLELLDGEILVMSPQGSRHATIVAAAAKALEGIFGSGVHIRQHSPIALDDKSEPEPDVFVVRGEQRDYLEQHPGPQEILLVLEVSDSSRAFDLGSKALAYARNGIREYWVSDLEERTLVVHREPTASGYASITRLTAPATVTPTSISRACAVSDLLP